MELDKMRLEMEKLRAEIAKTMRETIMAPFIAGATVMGAATGLAALFVHLFAH